MILIVVFITEKEKSYLKDFEEDDLNIPSKQKIYCFRSQTETNNNV